MVGVATTACLTMNIRIRKPCCRPRATPLMFPCRAYTESPAYLSGGFSVLTRDQLFPPICSHTWRSSPSGSTDALHVAVDFFFVDSWNKLSLPDLLLILTSPMFTTALAFAYSFQGGANLLPPLSICVKLVAVILRVFLFRCYLTQSMIYPNPPARLPLKILSTSLISL